MREYSRIYTGTNQENGYVNPFLEFSTDTIENILKKDKSTYFHYPKTAEKMPLSASELIDSGAFAGSMPYRADRIFKKQANYEKYSYWGKTQQEGMERGVWLCAWLSGNDSDPTQTPIWMDRWYNPGSFDSLLMAFTNNSSAVYDIPSELTFDPGVWYKYDHIGDFANTQIVNTLCGLKVHLESWNNQVYIDTSSYQNNGNIQNFSETCKSNGVDGEKTALKLNGINQYGSILYNNVFDVSSDVSCSVWVNSNNWYEQPSHHLISNGLRGGWSIGINNGFFNPYVVALDQSGNMVFNNQIGNFYKNIILPGISNPVSFAQDSELYTWVLDNGIYEDHKHLYKIDYDGNVDNAVHFDSSINLVDMLIDASNSVWVTDGINISSFNTYCQLISTNILSGTKLVLDGYNNLTAFDAIDACNFDNRYYWTIENGDVFYTSLSSEKFTALSAMSASNVQCTKDYVWILYDYDKIIRLDEYLDPVTHNTSFIIGASASIPDVSYSNISGRNLFFTNENNSPNDYVWILQPSTEYLYKYNINLDLIHKTNMSYVKYPISTNAIKGDASGYQWNRLFNYGTLDNEMPQIEASVYLRTNTDSLTCQKYTTIIPISSLTVNDWHMFTFNINNTNNILSFYMDSILRDTISIPASSSIYYKYETPLLLGGNIGKINSLDEEFDKMGKLYHNGSFDDVRIYTTPLNNSDIRHIYLSKFEFRDLVWNMPIGYQSYIEEIVRFFKFKMPGQKSQYYNIHLKGLQITDEGVRKIIEGIIKDSIQKIAPLYTSLYKIIWD